MGFLTLIVIAVFGVASANAAMLQFSATTTDNGAVASFTLDTNIPNTYDPILYPSLPAGGVYLNAVHNLLYEGTAIAVSDVSTGPGMTGDGRPLTIMNIGPLLDNQSLSIELILFNPMLVAPLQSDPGVYERAFEPLRSVLFPQIPPPRTHVDLLVTLTVTEVPEPSFMVALAMIGLTAILLRRQDLHPE